MKLIKLSHGLWACFGASSVTDDVFVTLYKLRLTEQGCYQRKDTLDVRLDPIFNRTIYTGFLLGVGWSLWHLSIASILLKHRDNTEETTYPSYLNLKFWKQTPKSVEFLNFYPIFFCVLRDLYIDFIYKTSHDSLSCVLRPVSKSIHLGM